MKFIRNLIALVIVSGFLYGVFEYYTFMYRPMSSSDHEFIYEVSPGPFVKTAQELYEIGAIKSVLKFRILAKLTGKEKAVRVGEYRLDGSMLPLDILNTITSGKSIERSITFKEGINLPEMAEVLEAKGFSTKEEFLSLVKDKKFIFSLLGEQVDTLEGYLFPETYNYTKYTDLKALLSKMVGNFLEVYNKIDKRNFSLSRHQAVTFASVIEKETGAPEERPIISSVFHNRLKKKMRLQSDPTIIYGIWAKTGVLINNIKKKHLLEYTPHNTYTVKALPVGPISNPGKDSLEAVFNPEATPYLYFVSKNDGTHYFSRTYEEHNRAVKRFQLNRSARKGKSWRDLNKRSQAGN